MFIRGTILRAARRCKIQTSDKSCTFVKMSVSRETVLEFIETINKDHVKDVVGQSCDFLSFFEENLEIKTLQKEKQTEASQFLNRKNSKYNSMKMVRRFLIHD